MNHQLESLLNCQPNWVAVQRKACNAVEIIAQPPIKETGLTCLEYCLELKIQNSKISVNEVGDKKHLPTACPCRHLNFDGSFCLGIDDNISKTDSKSWWRRLAKFLQLQEVAEENKAWQPYLDEFGKLQVELSHGNAADYQIEAEKLASELGIRNCYDSALIGRINLLPSLPINRRKIDDKKLNVNGRGPCYIGCTKRKKPILRRNCGKKNTCEKFIEAETNRQIEARKFVENYGKNGCKLDMRYCEFASRKQRVT